MLDAVPEPPSPIVGKPRPFVKKWSVDELVPIVEGGLTKRDFNRGRRLFGEANCFACHRFDNEGGPEGPDLTGTFRAVQCPQSAGVDCPAEQGDQRPVCGLDLYTQRRPRGHRPHRQLPRRQHVGNHQHARSRRDGPRKFTKSRVDRAVASVDDARRFARHVQGG